MCSHNLSAPLQYTLGVGLWNSTRDEKKHIVRCFYPHGWVKLLLFWSSWTFVDYSCVQNWDTGDRSIKHWCYCEYSKELSVAATWHLSLLGIIRCVHCFDMHWLCFGAEKHMNLMRHMQSSSWSYPIISAFTLPLLLSVLLQCVTDCCGWMVLHGVRAKHYQTDIHLCQCVCLCVFFCVTVSICIFLKSLDCLYGLV